MSHPHSLFVHSKETHTQPYRASTSHPADDNFHRRNVEHKKAMKKELDGWMDLLMESDRVERGVLKRASLYLRPSDYDEITHERHLNSLCSYPLCSSPPFRRFSSSSRYTFIRTPISPSSSNNTSSRQLIEQEDGNLSEGFCTPRCMTRSHFFKTQLAETAIWTRDDLRSGDLMRYKSKARGYPGVEEKLRAREVQLLEEMEERGEVVIRSDGSVERNEAYGKDVQVEEKVEVGKVEKKQLVVETKRDYSTFEAELNATLASLRIVERGQNGEITNPTPLPDNPINGTTTPFNVSSPSRPLPKLNPLPHELLPERDDSNELDTGERHQEVEEEDEYAEDEEMRKAFEEAMEARELLKEDKFD